MITLFYVSHNKKGSLTSPIPFIKSIPPTGVLLLVNPTVNQDNVVYLLPSTL